MIGNAIKVEAEHLFQDRQCALLSTSLRRLMILRLIQKVSQMSAEHKNNTKPK